MNVSALRFVVGSGPLVLSSRASASTSQLELDAPAVNGMIDFDEECPAIVHPDRSIEATLAEMRLLGVRAMVVARNQRVMGLITAEDIEGERPIQFLQSTDCLQPRCQHADIKVADLMIPWDALPTVAFEDVLQATLGQVATTMAIARENCLAAVVEDLDSGCLLIRGLFTRVRLERHLGRPLSTS